MQTEPEFRVASICDTAIDLDGMGMRDAKRYARERDASLVKELPGKRVTWFTLRRIPTSLYQRFVMNAATDGERFTRAFMAAVESIHHLVGMDGEYRALFEPTGEAHTPLGPMKVWRDDALELIPPAYIEEIGSVAMLRSALSPKAKPVYHLPHLSLLALTARISPDVDGTRKTAARLSDEAREQQESPPGDGGGAPTGAPAMAKATGE